MKLRFYIGTVLFYSGTLILAFLPKCKATTPSVFFVNMLEQDTLNRGNVKKEIAHSELFLERFLDPILLTGTIQKEVQISELEKWLSKNMESVNVAPDKNMEHSTPLLVFGDGLAAGWKDGGLYREGQQFAFPNLVAHQMGIKDFNSPLFEPENGNGTGYLVREPGKYPRWREVNNNLAVDISTDLPELVPYRGDEPENLASPRVSRGGISGALSPLENGWVCDEYGRGYTDDMVFLWRLYPEADKYKLTYWSAMNEKLKSKQPAVVFSIFGFDEIIIQNLKNKHVKMSWGMASSEVSPLTVLVAAQAKELGAKGVVFTIPDFKHLPYFNWYTWAKLNTINPEVKLFRSRDNVIGAEPISGNIIFLPTKNVELLFKSASGGGTFEFPLLDSDVADNEEILGGTSAAINKRIVAEAKERGLVLVDLASLYEKIAIGGFKTDDGFVIGGGVDGNFFSSDGIYPSSIGNAVIANETIKALNEAFNYKIPLINVHEFASYQR